MEGSELATEARSTEARSTEARSTEGSELAVEGSQRRRVGRAVDAKSEAPASKVSAGSVRRGGVRALMNGFGARLPRSRRLAKSLLRPSPL